MPSTEVSTKPSIRECDLCGETHDADAWEGIGCPYCQRTPGERARYAEAKKRGAKDMPSKAVTRNHRSREEWAALINANWRKSIEGIFQVGGYLSQARLELGAAGFEAMVREDLDFGPSVALTLKRIAEHPRVQQDLHRLPARWSVLNQLIKLSPEDWDWAKERDLIDEQVGEHTARALVDAVNTRGDTSGPPIGEGRQQHKLPSPIEANKIARETGRPVAGSDGNIHFGHSDARAEEIQQQRSEDYGVIRAIGHLTKVSEIKSPDDWWKDMPDWRREQVDPEQVDTAIKWLAGLYEVSNES